MADTENKASSAAAAATATTSTADSTVVVTAAKGANAKYVTAATFDPKRLVFGEFESKPVKGGEATANFESIGIKYRYSDAPDDEGSPLKWATPVMVSPRGFGTRNINGKNEWSYMVTFTPDEDPDWDEETLKVMATDPVYKQRKEEEWAKKVAESKALLEDEVDALSALTDAVIAHIETLKDAKKYPKLKNITCIRTFSGDAFGRLPYTKDADDPHYTAWLKLMDIPATMTANGKPALANVAWPDGELIPKSAPKGSECFTWGDLVEKHLNVESLFTIRGVFFGKVNKLQTSAVSVLVHSVRAAEAFDPLASKGKAAMADKEKAQAVARNKARLVALKKEPATTTTTDDGERSPAANMAEEDDDADEQPRRPAVAPKRAAAGAKQNTPAASRGKEAAATAPVRSKAPPPAKGAPVKAAAKETTKSAEAPQTFKRTQPPPPPADDEGDGDDAEDDGQEDA